MPGIPSGNKQLQMAGLDSLGNRDFGDQVTMSETAQRLILLSGFLIAEAQNNLNKGGNEATGDLGSSIKARDIQIDGGLMYVDIELLDRYDFINSGVKGVESGQGKYQFKTKRPSLGMKSAIKSWLRLRGTRATKYKAISKAERKDQGIKRTRAKTDSQESLAWAVATSIKKKGIKPTKFWDRAVKATEKKQKKFLSEGFKVDIINSIKWR